MDAQSPRNDGQPKPRVLYISYDGMLEPLGQSQVLAYLERLSADYRIHLISFEKSGDWAAKDRRQALRRRIAEAGIGWTPLRYHKAPSGPATAYDIAVGTMVALWLTLRHRIRIVHARSYIPALMALAAQRLLGARFLFDMRGLWADERVDAGLWPKEGRFYRVTKKLERAFLLAADHVVTLTRASAREIAGFPYLAGAKTPITVIPTCADLDRFSRSGTGAAQQVTFGFVGAASTWSLFDEVLECHRLLLAREPDARLLIVNRGEHDFIRERLRQSGIDPAQVELVASDHAGVPALISRMTIAAAIRKPAYSQVACAPTKLAEYLGCGVPCLVNEGVGDVAEIVESERVGVVLRGFSPADKADAIDRLLALSRESGIKERCVAAARRRFSLEDGVSAYREIYDRLASRGAPTVQAAA